MKTQNPRRILICVSDILTVNKLVKPQAIGFANSGWEVEIYSGVGEIDDSLIMAGIKIHQCKFLFRKINIRLDLLSLFYILRGIRGFKPSVVIGSTPKAAFIAMLASRIACVEFRIYQIRGAGWQTQNSRRAWILKTIDFITIGLSTHRFVVSRSILRDFQTVFPKSRFEIVGVGGSKGVDRRIFQIKLNNNAEPMSPKIGYLGRFTHDKGIDDLVPFFELLQGRIQGLVLEMIGDFDYMDPIDQRTTQKILSNDSIRIFSQLNEQEIANRVSDWDLHIFLSRREGLPNAVIETGACGVPTIGWLISGMSDAVPNSPDNFLVKMDDFDALMIQVENTLNHKDVGALKERTSAWTLENFDQDKVIQTFVTKVESIVGLK